MNVILNESEKLGLEFLGLDATNVGMKLYKKFGFVKVCDVPTCRVLDVPRVSSAILENFPMERVVELDSKATGMYRRALFRELLREGASFAVSSKGFVATWRGRIGPLVAESLGEAIALLSRAVSLGGSIISIPTSSPLVSRIL